MKKVFIITGEHSGDMHASLVVKELKKLNSEIEIEAIGGKNLEAQGVKLFANHDKMQAVGLTFKDIFNHFFLGKRLVDYIKKEFKPDLVLLIDYGVFNLNIAKFLKREKFKIFYFIPPQIWASRKWRIKTVKKYVDKVLTIFPFEKKMYDEYGIDAQFCGHPIIKELPPPADRKEFCARHNLDPNKKIVSIFPGSRIFEINYLLKIFLESAKIISKACPDVQFIVSQAPNLKDGLIKCDYPLIKGENHAMLSVSDMLILASGTVALEASLYQTPMIIAYRGPLLFYLIYLSVRSIKQACLANIISEKNIVPEFLMYDATSAKISKKVIELLCSDEKREKMRKDLGEVRSILSDKYAQGEAARIIHEELEKNG